MIKSRREVKNKSTLLLNAQIVNCFATVLIRILKYLHLNVQCVRPYLRSMYEAFVRCFLFSILQINTCSKTLLGS